MSGSKKTHKGNKPKPKPKPANEGMFSLKNKAEEPVKTNAPRQSYDIKEIRSRVQTRMKPFRGL